MNWDELTNDEKMQACLRHRMPETDIEIMEKDNESTKTSN